MLISWSAIIIYLIIQTSASIVSNFCFLCCWLLFEIRALFCFFFLFVLIIILLINKPKFIIKLQFNLDKKKRDKSQTYDLLKFVLILILKLLFELWMDYTFVLCEFKWKIFSLFEQVIKLTHFQIIKSSNAAQSNWWQSLLHRGFWKLHEGILKQI